MIIIQPGVSLRYLTGNNIIVIDLIDCLEIFFILII